MVDGHNAVVHLGTDHAVAHSRVDRIGEIDGGCPGGQVDHIAAGRKGKHLLGQKVALDIAQQFLAVVGFALDLQQLAHPGKAFV